MSKDPAFLFYPNDYLGGTMGMTFEQKGAYIDLLIFQFNNHHFTESQAKQVLSICFSSAWEVLKGKFKKDGDFYFNERLRDEINKRKAYTESRRNNALHTKNISKAYAKHMGNGNENRNKDINKDKINKERKIFTPPTLEEITNYCKERRNKIDPQLFIDKYIGNGWMVGKNKMKDWKAVVRTWEKNNFNIGEKNGTNTGFKANSYWGNNNDRKLTPGAEEEFERIAESLRAKQ
jgi:uncharacterized protein YdaU (DUF1376 family)